MYVCLCNAVTEREVRHAAELGATTLADLSDALGVATCCGRCADCARGILLDEIGPQITHRAKSRPATRIPKRANAAPAMLRLQPSV